MKTMIAIPCLETVHTDFFCAFSEMDKSEAKYMVTKSSLIYDARNKLAAHAIQNGFDAVLWLDSDMVFDKDILRRFEAHIEEGKEYISGIFFTRSNPVKPCIYRTLEYKNENNYITSNVEMYFDYPRDQVFEIAASGFGAVMTKVDLLKRVWHEVGAPFMPILGLGEDLAFCLRAINVGAKMYCDSRIKVGHVGYKLYDETLYENVVVKDIL